MPKKVEFFTESMTGKYIEYVYDATGVKLEKRVQEENLSSLSYTYYQGAYIYEKSTFSSPLTLKFISQPEGYIEPDNQGGFDYVYQFKDHLGNIRLSYKELKDLESHFINSKDGWQNAGNVTSTLENGKLKVNVDSAWEGIKQNFNGGLNTSPGEEILINLKIDKGNTQSNVRIIVQELDSNNNHISWNTVYHDLQTGSYSLNYTVNTGDKIKIKIDKVNTHTNSLTYFYVDHVIVSRNELEIIEENNYYPFGLKHKGYNNVTSGNVNSVASKFKYNGVELEESLGLNLYEMDFRQYDASLGRFSVVDPLAEEAYDYTPYRFGFNNPIFFSDPTGLWEKVNGGYKTTDTDEISRLLGYINREDSDVSGEGLSKFIKEDIAWFKDFNEALPLSTATIIQNKSTGESKMAGISVLNIQNEVAYYQRKTDYIYTRDDYEMRNRIFAGGTGDPITTEISRREKLGWFQPITAKNYISYIGDEKTARLLTYGSFMGMQLDLKGGPNKPITSSVKPRYLGLKNNKGTLARSRTLSNGTSNQTSSNPYQNISFKEFRAKFGHLFKGRFMGRGNYMTHMAKQWRMTKLGI